MKFLEVRAAIFLLLLSLTSACKSSGSSQDRQVQSEIQDDDFNEATEDEEASEAEKEDEEDETLEDFAQDAEDFDLMIQG